MNKTGIMLIMLCLSGLFLLDPVHICKHPSALKGFPKNEMTEKETANYTFYTPLSTSLNLHAHTEELSSAEQEKPQGVDVVLTWKILADVTYEKKAHPDYQMIQVPVFGKELKKLQGKKALIKGFIIPLGDGDYALSKTPYATCYFCGQEGPESVIGVKFKSINIKLKTDMNIMVKGTFILNDNDPDDWMYHLKSAEVYP
jgi:hypothetical protein